MRLSLAHTLYTFICSCSCKEREKCIYQYLSGEIVCSSSSDAFENDGRTFPAIGAVLIGDLQLLAAHLFAIFSYTKT